MMVADKRKDLGRRGGSDRRSAAPRRAESAPTPAFPLAHGWTLLAHPLLLDQLERLGTAAEREPRRGGQPGPNTKLLGHLLDLMLDKVPRDPGSSAYRHGGAIDGGHREWFRGKTGNGRYRLFYRFDSRAKIIIFAWVNDENTLRTTGASDDAYTVFARMLRDGNPPQGWDELLEAARETRTAGRFQKVAARSRRDEE